MIIKQNHKEKDVIFQKAFMPLRGCDVVSTNTIKKTVPDYTPRVFGIFFSFFYVIYWGMYISVYNYIFYLTTLHSDTVPKG